MSFTGRLAFYLGTFNPVHTGHLLVAQCALNQFGEQLGLEKIIFVPAGRSPWKQDDPDLLPSEARVKLLNLATSDHPQLMVSMMEVQAAETQKGPTYTSHTVNQIRKMYEMSAGEKVVLIMGADSVATLGQWHHAKQLIEHTHILQAPRPDYATVQSVEIRGQRVPIETTDIAMPAVGISSTQIRDWVKAGKSIRYQVPEAVQTAITKHSYWAAVDTLKREAVA